MYINPPWITCADPQIKRPPMGAKRIPMMKRVGSTVFGVRIGCHAFRRCCLNAVSVVLVQHQPRRHLPSWCYVLAGRFQSAFFFWSSPSSEFEFRLNNVMVLIVVLIVQRRWGRYGIGQEVFCFVPELGLLHDCSSASSLSSIS